MKEFLVERFMKITFVLPMVFLALVVVEGIHCEHKDISIRQLELCANPKSLNVINPVNGVINSANDSYDYVHLYDIEYLHMNLYLQATKGMDYYNLNTPTSISFGGTYMMSMWTILNNPGFIEEFIIESAEIYASDNKYNNYSELLAEKYPRLANLESSNEDDRIPAKSSHSLAIRANVCLGLLSN